MDTCFNPFSLNGKTILVTGASSGIGLKASRRFRLSMSRFIPHPAPFSVLFFPGEVVLEYDVLFPEDSDLTYIASSYYTNNAYNHSGMYF